jgi:ABC-type transport system involved in multi-copper enzyme maturation permease subunit
MSKLLSGILINLVFAVVTILSVIPITRAYNISIAQNNFILLAAIGFFFGLAVFGLSMLTSAFFSDKGKALFLTIGVLLMMYVVNIVALLKASLENIKFASYFYYFDYSGMLLDGKIGKASVMFFILAFLGFSTVATTWFIKRDIAE